MNDAIVEMKIWIITMGFPLTSETFACNDVIALQRTGVKVAVHGLRAKHRLFSQIVVQRGLTDILILISLLKIFRNNGQKRLLPSSIVSQYEIFTI